MKIDYIYFIYGLCVMFYGMMAWFFIQKNREMLSRLVGVLMIVLSLQYVKDLIFLSASATPESEIWLLMTSVDMIAVPLYAFILIELCRPGTLNVRTIVLQELPFVLLPTLFIITHNILFYYLDVAWAALYGFGYAIWAIVNIPRYHRLLKEHFSYGENINLYWLRYILLSFFVILSLWIVDCLIINFNIDAGYMLGSLIIWMFICYFLYRHKSVIDELREPIVQVENVANPDDNNAKLKKLIIDLFENQRVYLNPQLKLSDVASMVNSNRTYVSRIFNDYHGKTFFEYVNEYRVRHAKTLLKTSEKKIEEIAELSGFSSRQSFHRIFIKIAGYTPEKYRMSEK